MTRLEAALIDIAGFLDARRTPYMVIGGFANLYWGKPRLTIDLDLKIEIPESSWDDLVRELAGRFTILTDDPLSFLRETRVLPIETPTRVRVDIVLADLEYEASALRRAVMIPVGERTVRVCTAEDLILHKIISDRARDREDVEGIVMVRADRLDRSYLDPWVARMAEGLERPDIMAFYHACLKAAGAPP